MNLNDLLLTGALILFFAPLEHLFPTGPRNWSPRRLTTDFLHLLVGGWLIRLGAVGAALVLGGLLHQVLPADWSAAVRAQPDWLEFVELLILSDLGFYAAHRLVHSVPWLWRFHEVHHSSEHLDCLATYRVHPVDQVINSTIIALPALALGFSPPILVAYGLLYKLHAMLLHSNLRVSFGPLKWLIASPHYHHWHHANERDAYDKNFGGQLVLFDWLFGTLNMPRHRPPAFGIGEPISSTFLGQLAHPFRRALAVSPASKEPA
jgi:sterol desaturase/sphingolipid hydroxylase (fatty acid hydroxylase superfamily)